MSNSFKFLKGVKKFKFLATNSGLFCTHSFSSFSGLGGVLRKFKSLSSLLSHLSSIRFEQSFKSKSVNWLLEQFNFSRLVYPFSYLLNNEILQYSPVNTLNHYLDQYQQYKVFLTYSFLLNTLNYHKKDYYINTISLN